MSAVLRALRAGKGKDIEKERTPLIESEAQMIERVVVTGGLGR